MFSPCLKNCADADPDFESLRTSKILLFVHLNRLKNKRRPQLKVHFLPNRAYKEKVLHLDFSRWNLQQKVRVFFPCCIPGTIWFFSFFFFIGWQLSLLIPDPS